MQSEIGKYYESCNSLKETAKAFGISYQKARKLLITNNEYQDDTTVQINKMLADGMSIDDISHKLKKSVKYLNSYLPYSKTEYNKQNPSDNAIKIRKCREKKKK